MKPCHKSNQPPRRPPAAQSQPMERASPPQDAALHRYAHPIRTARPAAQPSVEEILAGMLEQLSRQSEQLEKVLRHLEGDNLDTM
ncbi:MAG: hypothetical protein HDT14_06025 [Oscillibacter sp.]|nr:hypothetical protein [Oscillibacter sp.]